MVKLKLSWEAKEFTIVPYKGEDIGILGSVEDILSQLEDDQVTLATMHASRFSKVVQAVSITSS